MSSPGESSDFDLHGLVGVRVVDGTPADVAVVRRQLGHPETTLDREPDLTVRFVDRLAPSPLTLVGVGESGYDDDSFYLLQAKGGSTRRTRIPFDRLGPGAELVCERGIPAVPHLLATVNLVLLTRNVLPLHATALEVDGEGILVTGWSKGGKTETLLAATSHGARYVGDEWVHLPPDGRMLGLPEPIRLWAWQLAQRPDLLASRTAGERRRLRAWSTVSRIADGAADRSWKGSGASYAGSRPALGRQAYLQVPPADLFGADGMVSSARLDAVVLVLSHEAPGDRRTPRGARRDLPQDGRVPGRGARAPDGALPAVPLRLPRPALAAAGVRRRARGATARRASGPRALGQGHPPAPLRRPGARTRGPGRGTRGAYPELRRRCQDFAEADRFRSWPQYSDIRTLAKGEVQWLGRGSLLPSSDPTAPARAPSAHACVRPPFRHP